MARPAWRLLSALLLATGLCGARAMPARSGPDPAGGHDEVLGQWLTRDADGVFEIDRCGETLCGRLVGMRYHGSMPTDLHGQPQCHMQLLNRFVPTDAPGHFRGTIEDPDNGHTYQATIWSPSPGVLSLHGYLLLPILGETQRWTRYRGTIGPACKLPGEGQAERRAAM